MATAINPTPHEDANRRILLAGIALAAPFALCFIFGHTNDQWLAQPWLTIAFAIAVPTIMFALKIIAGTPPEELPSATLPQKIGSAAFKYGPLALLFPYLIAHYNHVEPLTHWLSVAVIVASVLMFVLFVGMWASAFREVLRDKAQGPGA